MPRAVRSSRSAGLIVGLTIAVLIAAGAMLAIGHSHSAAKQQRLVVGSYEAMAQMREVVSAIQDAELSQWRFLAAGDVGALQPYERARLRIETGLRGLDGAMLSGGGSASQIGEFRTLANDRLEQLGAIIAAHELYGREAALAMTRTGPSRATIEDIRRSSDVFIDGQSFLLARQLAMLRSEQKLADVVALLVMGGAFVCLVAGVAVIVSGAGRLERTRAALDARSRLLQTTLESLQDPIFVMDAEGIVVAWNVPFTRIADWDPALRGSLTRDQLLSELSPITRAMFGPLNLDVEASAPSVTERVTYDGRNYDVSRFEMAGGGAVVRCVDVTEKLRDDVALRQGQKMEAIGQLTGGMAHDFNNILQVIRSNLDLMRNDAGTNAGVLARLQVVAAASDRGARLTQQLLAFARRQPLAPQSTDVARLVSELSDLLRHSLGEFVGIELSLADDSWKAKIDASQLENAILNLAINARDAMPDGGTLTIEVSNATLDRQYAALDPEVVPGEYVRIAVSDTGAGMAPDVVEQAFDPFFTTKRYGKGTGLGLSMVYGFVRQSGGHIRIDSAIGQGTSVKVYLPRTLDPVAEFVTEPAAPPTGTERILVVEDNDEVRSAAADMLTGWGYRVSTAENPDAAVALLERDPAFDLLFTDVVMPGTLSVIEMAEQAQRLRPGIAVLLTSGYAREMMPALGRLGYALIAKPYGGDELAVKVRAALSARPEPIEQAREADTGAGTKRPRRVLLVEDEVVLRLSTSDILERLGCFVASVGTAEQALDLLSRDDKFELMVTDLGLPGMSGEALAAEVRLRYPRLAVIIASGYGRPATDVDGLQFIAKPYSSIDLEQALDRMRRTVPAS